MAKLNVDFELLIESIEELEQLEKRTTEPTIEITSSNLEKIIQVGKNHDSCFSGINQNVLTDSIETTSQELTSLIKEIEMVIGTTLDYSCSPKSQNVLLENKKIDSIEISGLAQALVWKIENTSNNQLSSIVSKEPITADYDVEFYNNLLKQIQESNATQREKITATAVFMTSYFPHLPYFWGGGHRYDLDQDASGNEKMGVNDLWGSLQTERYYDAYGNLSKEVPNQVYGIDCSGFVNFVLRNNGYDASKVTCDCNDLSIMSNVNGVVEPIPSTVTPQNIQAGDIVHMNGHIGMVVKAEGNEITIAHSSGSVGLGYTTMDVTTGNVIADSSKPERMNQPYFTEVLEVSDY